MALVPCFVFLLAGAGGAGYLIYDAVKTRNYFDLASQAQRAALPLIMSVEEERRLTLRNLASLGTFETELIRQREQTNQLVEPVRSTLAELNPVAPDSVRAAADQVTELMATELPRVRAAVDNNQITVNDAFLFYNTVVDHFIAGAQGVAQFGPDAESVHQIGVTTGPLLTAADQMLRADALASANLAGGGLSQADFRSYQGLVSAYHLGLDKAMALTIPDVQAGYAQLKESPSWQRLVSVENALLGGGDRIPISEDLWRAAAKDVGDGLMAMLTTQSRATMAAAVDRLDTTLTQSIIAGAVVLALAVAVFVFALRLSRRLIERLTRLRTETLDLAETGLPELVERVRTGADVPEDAVRLHDHGRDEIGQVAEAFNKAQRTAVNAAVQEAKTREGTNTVFLNIARRSQVIVHRQLKVLDEAERRQEDPELLEMLFQLDHLSTRARRNAENLIILGGGQPGRRWRNPVSLTELARGAAAETEDFARVKIAKLPPVAVNGPVVGDLVHLLAELVDNAASFSPPDSRVDVRGNVVGKGVVLEVEDQGVGIEPARTEAFNDMLRNPPDFGIMALSDEPRLGLFVVARLAARHGIAVTLRESPYGGTRAIVLVRTDLLTDVPPDEEPHQLPAAAAASEAVTEAASEAARPPEPMPEPMSEPVSEPMSAPVTVSNGAPDLTAFLQPLPSFPVVEPQPGEDLFRPQRPVEDSPAPGSHLPPRQLPPRPEPPRLEPSPEQPPAAEPLPGGRPALPQRRRQQNLAPQLRAEPEPTWPEAENAEGIEQTVEDTPDAARSRLSAFVLGTRRGREEPGPGHDETNGNGVRNGQHRAE
nr:nitrate- and nitrite sensing domain-containing protein [Actinophytocola xinjiangensis]